MATEAGQRLQFYPFAYALATEEIYNFCWYCLAPLQDKSRCTGCQCAYYCNRECAQLGWKDHKAECAAINKTGEIPDIETRFLGRIVIRHKDIVKKKDVKIDNFYKDRTSQRKIMEIWAHTEEMKKDPRAMKKFEEIYENLVTFYDAKHMLSKEVVFELHCRNYINRHAISDKAYVKEIGKGLYLDLCAYDHSCRPNTIYTCNGFVATLRSLDGSNDIRNRETSFYSYIDLLNSQPERLKQLKDTWYFDCKCTRCVDPQDHILTGLKCPNCPKDAPTNLCIFGNHEYKNKSTAVITCPKCKKEMTREYVFEGINTMKFINKVFNDKEIEQMPPKTRVEFLEDLLERAMKILPDVNFYVSNIVQQLIPLVDVKNHKELLRLHVLTEPCVRFCYPKNHPGVAFHLRSIGLFYSGLNDFENAIKYIKEAIEILNFTLDADHPMTIETEEILRETIAAAAQQEGSTATTTSDQNPNGEATPKASLNEQPNKKPMEEHLENQTEKQSEKKPDVISKEPEQAVQVSQNSDALASSDLFSDNVDDLPELIA